MIQVKKKNKLTDKLSSTITSRGSGGHQKKQKGGSSDCSAGTQFCPNPHIFKVFIYKEVDEEEDGPSAVLCNAEEKMNLKVGREL